MCRLLIVKSDIPFSISHHLKKFSLIAENSKEYQGHGWGCAYLQKDNWQFYKNIKPIWQDNLDGFGSTNLLIGHARSAFENKNIKIENNMPFFDDHYVFVFNGELQGVRLNEKGRIGAEKIFNFIKRFNRNDMVYALKKGVSILQKRTKYIRAMNIIIADKNCIYVSTNYNEDPDYFTLHIHQLSGQLIICSEKYPGEEVWRQIENNSVEMF